jgi:hypothetical protein
MKNVLLFCALILAHTASAQLKLTWQNCYGGPGTEFFRDVKHTADGGYIMVGQASTYGGDVTGPMRGSNDAWIIKTDSNGAPQWNKILGGTGGDFAESVCETADSGFLVLIWSNSQDYDMGIGWHGGQDAWVAKLTSTGALSWIKSYGGTGSDVPATITPTPDGNYVVLNNTNSSNGDISGAKGGQDAWLFKISPANGDIIWQHSYGGNNNESLVDLQVANDGGFIMCGVSTVANGDVTANHGMGDMWIVKTDSLGTLEWQKNVGGTQADGGTGIVPTFDGGYAAVGFTSSNDMDVTGYKDSTDILLAKLSSTGTLLWAKALGGTGPDTEPWGNDITQTRDSNLLILTRTESSDGDITEPNHGDYEIWLPLVDQNGNIKSQLVLGGSKRDEPYCLEMVSDSVYVIGGITNSTDGDASGGGLYPTPFFYHDGWLLQVKVPITLSVETPQLPSASVKVYPTVTTNSVNVVFDASFIKKRVVLVNAAGQVVADHSNIKREITSIPFWSLPAGNYFLKVIADEQTTTHKIIYQP